MDEVAWENEKFNDSKAFLNMNFTHIKLTNYIKFRNEYIKKLKGKKEDIISTVLATILTLAVTIIIYKYFTNNIGSDVSQNLLFYLLIGYTFLYFEFLLSGWISNLVSLNKLLNQIRLIKQKKSDFQLKIDFVKLDEINNNNSNFSSLIYYVLLDFKAKLSEINSNLFTLFILTFIAIIFAFWVALFSLQDINSNQFIDMDLINVNIGFFVLSLFILVVALISLILFIMNIFNFRKLMNYNKNKAKDKITDIINDFTEHRDVEATVLAFENLDKLIKISPYPAKLVELTGIGLSFLVVTFPIFQIFQPLF